MSRASGHRCANTAVEFPPAPEINHEPRVATGTRTAIQSPGACARCPPSDDRRTPVHFLPWSGAAIVHHLAGALAFSSWNQFCTSTICVMRAGGCSTARTMRKR